MRADSYQGLEDAVVAGDTDASAVGRRIVFPSSFTGGPRNMKQHYQDTMAICRTIGTPNLFITFTCNPNWSKISQVLQRHPGQPDQDKPITPKDIDEFICAEIPNKYVDHLAYETVVRSMVHRPCGPHNPNAPCLVDGKCSKHYPKKSSNQTTVDEDGFVSYRRRNNPKITDPVGLWERHWKAMTDDLQYKFEDN
ncbi:hypothetical protein Sango_0811500 [Sesamum angolense]|uniref:Helitron helicase-like domain-containing protein n=1 Tax=Sesamum angolense TaxID=2727404 RepID=A0AAE1X4A1_9LAMI|nr:hypothetical protein Sango_0811500 [Sesamum angolense]